MPLHRQSFEECRGAGPVYVAGCDTGPGSCAFATVLMRPRAEPEVVNAYYVANADLARSPELWRSRLVGSLRGRADGIPLFFCYEHCGCQGVVVGNDVIETAMMCGEVRRLYRPHVRATYAFSPSDWRYMLCGWGAAKTKAIYADLCNLFPKTGGGADPCKGTKAEPGPLWDFHKAGAGGNMEHMKDSLGVAMALDRVRYRTGGSPERFRRVW